VIGLLYLKTVLKTVSNVKIDYEYRPYKQLKLAGIKRFSFSANDSFNVLYKYLNRHVKIYVQKRWKGKFGENILNYFKL